MYKRNDRLRMAVLTTVSITIKAFYEGQFDALNQANIDTTVICGNDPELVHVLPEETRFLPVNFTRRLNPFCDLAVLWYLYKLFRKERFDLVQYSTPKAALLGSMASSFARVPNRLYLLWGLYYQGQVGLRKVLFKLIEIISCLLSTQVIPNSFEMADIVISDLYIKKTKCKVLLHGGACGVDLSKYAPQKWQSQGRQIRQETGIPPDAVVIGVFGRLTGDKGINEIVEAFGMIANEFKDVYLLVAGTQEEKDMVLPETMEIVDHHPRIKRLGWQKTLLPCYAAIDIFCLPSYREGFPQTPLEAQAFELPVVLTDIMGCREAISEGHTGYLVKVKDSDALIPPLKMLIQSSQLRQKMGLAGRERVEKMFNKKPMIEAVVEHRLSLMRKVH